MNHGEYDKADVMMNNYARTVVTNGLKLIPGAGNILSGVVVLFWPELDDVWDSIRQRTEKLIEAKINDNDFRQLSETLRDLKSSFVNYLNIANLAAKNEANGIKKDEVKTQWMTVEAAILGKVSMFMGTDHDAKHQLLMLPLFARFGLLYFSHLREAIEHGVDYGMSAGLIEKKKKDYQEKQIEFKAHIDKLYGQFIEQTKKAGWADYYPENEGSFWVARGALKWNQFTKMHNFFVLHGYNYVDLWEFLRYGANLKYLPMSHEIYSDACGTFGTIPMEDHAGHYGGPKQKQAYQLPKIPRPVPQKRISKIRTYCGAWIYAIEVIYQGGESSGRMGAKEGGDPYELDASTPITRVKARGAQSRQSWMPESYVYGIQFDQGSNPTQYCKPERPAESKHSLTDVDFSYPGMCLSSIFGQKSKDYTHNCFVFGFKYINSYDDQDNRPPELAILKVLYCTVLNTEELLANVEKQWGMRKVLEKAIADEKWDEVRAKNTWLKAA